MADQQKGDGAAKPWIQRVIFVSIERFEDEHDQRIKNAHQLSSHIADAVLAALKTNGAESGKT